MYRVLLVEDEKIELDTLRDYINWDKISVNKVYTARNGRSALECIEQNEPDIMITDIQMPVMNGIELAKRVREEGYKTILYHIQKNIFFNCPLNGKQFSYFAQAPYFIFDTRIVYTDLFNIVNLRKQSKKKLIFYYLYSVHGFIYIVFIFFMNYIMIHR